MYVVVDGRSRGWWAAGRGERPAGLVLGGGSAASVNCKKQKERGRRYTIHAYEDIMLICYFMIWYSYEPACCPHRCSGELGTSINE